jgi:hypothetical protein
MASASSCRRWLGRVKALSCSGFAYAGPASDDRRTYAWAWCSPCLQGQPRRNRLAHPRHRCLSEQGHRTTHPMAWGMFGIRTARELVSGTPPAWPQSRLLSPAAICIYMQQDRHVCDPALRDTLSQVEKAIGSRRFATPDNRRARITAHLHYSCITGSPQRSSGDQIQSRSTVCTGLSIRRYRVEPEFRADRKVRVFHS